VQDLSKKKEYKQETTHLAGSLADRYLSIILDEGKPVPNLFLLGATVMLMAAKLEQPISPSFNRMLALLPTSEQNRTSKQDIINLEEQILKTLKFSLHYVGPIPFIERFQRLFGLDQEAQDHDFKQVGFTARQFCKYMQRYGQFLQWKPSQLAAAAFILSINLNLSAVGPNVGLRPLRSNQVQQLIQGTLPVNLMAELTGACQQTQ
jgi:cyclin B